MSKPLTGALTMMLFAFGGAACDRPAHGAELPAPNEDLSAPEASEQAEPRTAIFAGGCFWCVEAVFEQLEGVQNVVSGYAGGKAETATYEAVSRGATDHAEAVRITYDPSKISFGTLLRVFFSTHDPTQLNRQGPDWGKQYRSAIFYANDDEKRVAEAYIKQLNEAGVFDEPIVTTLEPLEAFYEAEQYHQDFVARNPKQGYVRMYAWPKVEKVHKLFPDRMKVPEPEGATKQ